MGVLEVTCGAAGALARVFEIFWFRRPVEWVRAVLPRGSCFFGGFLDYFLWVCWGPVGPCVAADALVVLLGGYRGAEVGACAVGLWLSWPFLDFLLGGLAKIQLTQIIQFANAMKFNFQTNVFFLLTF